jgi:protein involved in polysaccharide export with SLBB domain
MMSEAPEGALKMKILYRWTMPALAGLLIAVPAAAQSPAPRDAAGVHLSRTQLQALLQENEATAASSSASRDHREQARLEAGLLRQRLEHGDLRVGDRVLLTVQLRPELSDTLQVIAGRRLIVPTLGEVSVEGILHSELQPHLQAFIGRFLQNPTVHATSLVRVEVRGAVGRPGFYTVTPDMLLSDVFMIAGGPDRNARTEGTRIARGRDVVWPQAALREAVAEGRTLDQLSVRAGDVVIVPEQGMRLTFQTVLYTVSAVSTVLLLFDRARR